MPYRITYALDLFNGPKERALSHATLNVMLRALTEIDVLYLRAHPETPLLHQSGVRYMEEPPGQEDWQDIPTTLAMGIGDCVPLDCRIQREDGSKDYFKNLKVGDRIMGDGRIATVLEVCATGEKELLDIGFDRDKRRSLFCTPEHKLILKSGEEIHAKDLRIDQELLSLETPAKVNSISRFGGRTQCGDVKTDLGRFYLPDSDVVVHNCEDIACWLAAEYIVRKNIPAQAVFKETRRSDGGYLFHILVRLPDGRLLDPSRDLGMR